MRVSAFVICYLHQKSIFKIIFQTFSTVPPESAYNGVTHIDITQNFPTDTLQMFADGVKLMSGNEGKGVALGAVALSYLRF